MDDGHFFTFATVMLGVILFFVMALGGVMIYLFLTQPQPGGVKVDVKEE